MNPIKQLSIKFPEFELERWECENGSILGILVDESEETWEKYCKAVVESSKKFP